MKTLILSLFAKFPVFSVAIFSFSALQAEEPTPQEKLRALLEANEVVPLDPKPEFSDAKIKLGQALFFDPVIGGNRDVSCATCHHPTTASAYGRSRSVGTRAYLDMGRRMPEGLTLVEVEGRDPVL